MSVPAKLDSSLTAARAQLAHLPPEARGPIEEALSLALHAMGTASAEAATASRVLNELITRATSAEGKQALAKHLFQAEGWPEGTWEGEAMGVIRLRYASRVELLLAALFSVPMKELTVEKLAAVLPKPAK